jgi:dTDP-4-dehydrorhamnose 3,5-epimerase
MKYRYDETIKDLVIIEVDSFYDYRGEYVNTYNSKDYEFLNTEFLEDDFSFSRKNVLRGLHGDPRTKKLIQCIKGEIVLGVVDMRKESHSYLQSLTFTLNDKNRLQILVPEGCVNGHLCVTEECIFSYKQSELYTGPSNQMTVRYDEPLIAIEWPVVDPILSKRDREAPYLETLLIRDRGF